MNNDYIPTLYPHTIIYKFNPLFLLFCMYNQISRNFLLKPPHKIPHKQSPFQKYKHVALIRKLSHILCINVAILNKLAH